MFFNSLDYITEFNQMDPEELIKRCRAIKLSEDEEGRVAFRSKMKARGENIIVGCLIGKVLHTRG